MDKKEEIVGNVDQIEMASISVNSTISKIDTAINNFPAFKEKVDVDDLIWWRSGLEDAMKHLGGLEEKLLRESLRWKQKKEREDVVLHTNDFIQWCCEAYPEEACGYLYARRPFEDKGKWIIYPVANVAEDRVNGWKAYKRHKEEAMEMAREEGFTCIGTVHSHTISEEEMEETDDIDALIQRHGCLSVADISRAQSNNEIVRLVFVMPFGVPPRIFCYDQFGEQIDIDIELDVHGRDICGGGVHQDG